MIRQAHTYMVGAVSGTALIAAAVVAFVLLVSAQALRDWPLAGLPDLGGGSDEASSVAGGPATGGAAASGAAAADGSPAKGGAESPGGQSAGRQVDATGAPVSSPPTSDSPVSSPSPGSPDSGANPAAGSEPSGSSSAGSPGSGSGGGGGGGQTSGGGAGGSEPSTSGQVTGLVNDTVSGVDKATGGALGNTGVTKATEEVVSGVAGPESPVGKTVDKALDTVGGLLGGGK